MNQTSNLSLSSWTSKDYIPVAYATKADIGLAVLLKLLYVVNDKSSHEH